MSFIPSKLQTWGEQVAEIMAEARTAKEVYKTSREKYEEAKKKVQSAEEAQAIAQTLAKDIQEKTHSKISSVVSRCLSSVFDNPYSFKILFERKRGKTEAVLVFERKGKQIDPISSSGGGPVDLAAFALRLSCIMLSRPRLRRVLVMDEPFKSPSPHYRERVRKLIETLSEELGIQFILVTNIMELVTGKTINLSKEE